MKKQLYSIKDIALHYLDINNKDTKFVEKRY